MMKDIVKKVKKKVVVFKIIITKQLNNKIVFLENLYISRFSQLF